MKQRRKAERRDFIRQFEFELIEPGKSTVATRRARGVDISSDGLGFLTEGRLKKGMVLKLALPAQGVDANLPVFGEVVWSSPVAAGLRAGLRFLR